MKPFAELLDRLLYTPQRNVKVALILDYFRTVPDPDRGWGLAALTGALSFAHAKPALIRELVAGRTDPVLFGWSYDFVGDLAETAALIWPEPQGERRLAAAGRGGGRAGDGAQGRAAADSSPAGSTRSTPPAAGRCSSWSPAACASAPRPGSPSWRWPSMAARSRPRSRRSGTGWRRPTPALFAWLDGNGPRPSAEAAPVFRPADAGAPARGRGHGQGRGRARPLPRRMEVGRHPRPDRGHLRRRAALLAHRRRHLQRLPRPGRGRRRSRACSTASCWSSASGEVASFNDLQQRLNRKAVTAAACSGSTRPSCASTTSCSTATRICGRCPCRSGGPRLEAFFARERPARMDVSPLVEVAGLADLERLRGGVRGTPIEGLMLKRKDSPYLAGRPKGLWWKWKRDAHLLDVVLMYAQRGHGKRSSFYSDFTFGAWRDGPAGRGAGPGRQGLFRLHRRGAAPARPLDPRPHHPPLRPGARGHAGPGARGRVRFRAPLDPAQVRAWPCASRASIASAGTSRPRRPTGWRRWSG